MPELPEVESVRRGLADHLTGATVTEARVLHPRSVRDHPGGPDAFAAELVGRRFMEPRRRGKFLWLPFDDGDALLAHLGMSGQFRVGEDEIPLRHPRVTWRQDDGRTVVFADQRMFGGLRISSGGAETPPEIAHIAVDPLDPRFNRRRAMVDLRARRSPVKSVLLNQQWVSGIGNIYADEALWRSRLHPLTPACDLTGRRAGMLIDNVVDVLVEALDQGGTSFDALYVNVNGESGYFDRSLDAYGREDLPCRRCGTPMIREQFANRSSTRCPKCQRRR